MKLIDVFKLEPPSIFSKDLCTVEFVLSAKLMPSPMTFQVWQVAVAFAYQ